MTAIEAMNDCIRLWDWCAETGRRKINWPEWEFNGGTVTACINDCSLCEYATIGGRRVCTLCPMFGHWGTGDVPINICLDSFKSLYARWEHADDTESMKDAAAALVARLREVVARMEAGE